MAEATLCQGSLKGHPLQRMDELQKGELAGCRGDPQLSDVVRVVGPEILHHVPEAAAGGSFLSGPGSPVKCLDKFKFVRKGF
jgi:hypothetical protein